MNIIENREDVHLLVNTFYVRVRKDDVLGPIFNEHISELKWPEHLETLTDFWESNLFGVIKFKGNPSQKHMKVDKKSAYTIESAHFGRWLELWVATLDELFEGDKAIRAKQFAQKMATGQYLTIWQNRPQKFKKTNGKHDE